MLRLTKWAVAVVTVVAAVASFGHIETLALTHGQSHLNSLLLPVSVDGTVAAASLAMLTRACQGWGHLLAQVMLGLGVTATVIANALSALPHLESTTISVGVATLPAIFFVGSVELLIIMFRSGPARDSHARTVTVAADTSATPDDIGVFIRANDGLSVPELAAKAGVSVSTIYRGKRGMNGAHAAGGSTVPASAGTTIWQDGE
jgi:Protein of unknown function (DUF2637)